MRVVLLLTSTLLVCACATAQVLKLDATPRPARPVDSVAILVDEPKQQYQSIALIEVSDESWGLSLTELANKMKSTAAKLGGDAVILGTQATTTSGGAIVPVGTSWIATTRKEKKLIGKVVVFAKP